MIYITMYGNVEESFLGRVKRAGYIIVWYLYDHAPVHIHIYRDGRMVCKWAINLKVAIEGQMSKKLLRVIDQLEKEGCFDELKKQHHN